MTFGPNDATPPDIAEKKAGPSLSRTKTPDAVSSAGCENQNRLKNYFAAAS
jgi:hypothetical protein